MNTAFTRSQTDFIKILSALYFGSIVVFLNLKNVKAFQF